MSRQTKFLIALAIAFASVTVMSVLADTIYLPAVYRQPTPTATKTPTPTARPPGIYIDGFNPSEYPTSDYVTVINTQTKSQDFSGWFMKNDKVWTPFNFPDGFILASGKSVRIYSSTGENTASSKVLYWNLLTSLWIIEDNCAYLRDDDRDLVHKWCVDWELD